ncbi:hypothetical protein BBK36DRAFT_1115671 [Trichoderma citrinoviride]|uniref:2EXR domain-containing protein n=1 Tax=Trichoderma citrinoviride TaxID=58853 RepID=A0A2T4BEK6_9HYPO|nr:hypothetical protein BBK36DRAFT_1115671 [Trichoderma citrinoviride]PTB67770.1 hypothetical protein BBK36DRAFT_1115671 [Trichoderma citrinoviride]
MGSLPTEFSPFPRLPAELRLKVWKSVPRPSRVIGILPPASDWYRHHFRYIGSRASRRAEEQSTQQRYHYRYIVQPKEHAIFPLLHANHEARAVWLPHFFQPSHFCNVSGVDIRFDTPFISYDTDTFTVFDGWPSKGIPEDVFLNPLLADTNDEPVDGFIALDRNRITNVALCEIPGDMQAFASALAIRTLPNIQTLTILALGPDAKWEPESLAAAGSGVDITYSLSVLEMLAVDVQRMNADIYDLPLELVQKSPFFNDARLRHAVALSPNIRPLGRYKTFVLSLLWHELREEHAAEAVTASWWDYVEYLFGSGAGSNDAKCPLMLRGCGADGHTRREMMGWRPRFEVNYKLLAAADWRVELERIGIVKS